jgi:RND family efflux transporter MFP subunit
MKCFQVTQPDGTKRKVCPALGTFEELARFSLHAADEAVAASQAQINALTAGAGDRLKTLETGIQLAEAQLGVAQARLDLAKAATPVEQIAAAQATIDQAQAALDAASVLMERYELRAPISGTAGAVDVRVGEMISPDEPLITVGDLSTLRVETTDLDEVDVARVVVGQNATVTFDALQDQLFTGRVTRISPMAEPGTGGVNYTVVVELEELDPLIRWGMTAFVDIEVE